MSRRAATLIERREARVLIIEDEPMLAYALEEVLSEAGLKTSGVAGRLDSALALIEIGDCDVAIVDANLAGVSAGPAASALAAHGIPYIVVSGYSPEQQQGAFSGALFIQKPCRPNELIRALRSVLPANEFWPTDAP